MLSPLPRCSETLPTAQQHLCADLGLSSDESGRISADFHGEIMVVLSWFSIGRRFFSVMKQIMETDRVFFEDIFGTSFAKCCLTGIEMGKS